VAIVNGLRALARDGSSDPMKSIPLAQILDDTIPFCRGKITAANIDLEVQGIEANIYVCCRSVQLSQALLNLLNNAYDAVVNEKGGKIEVFTQKTRRRVEIRVRDNGPGVPEEIRQSLFQPFMSTKELGKGLGLGLSVSKDMIEANGGELFLAPNCSQTTFVISLPRVDCE
jgi:C4-dicarboxylate-specific signal transduction histidine kinase